MQKTGRRVGLGLKAGALLTLAALLASCSTAGSEGTEGPDDVASVRLATTASTGALAAWVADREGFFADHKIKADVDVISTTVSAQVPSLLGRQYDVAAMTPPSLISAAEGGIDVVCVSASYTLETDDDVTIVIAAADSGIKSAADLAGKRLAAPSIAGNVHTATAYWLIEEGVDLDSVDVVAASTPNMPDLLRTGQVDAAELTMPYVGMMLSEGYTKVGDPLPAVADPVQMSFWASTREWGEGNQDVIGRLRAALNDAEEWMSQNEEAALDVLFEYTKIDEEYRPHTELPTYTTDITAEDLQAWKNAMNVVTGFETDIDMASLVVDPQ